jgi:Ferrous iron transport protein B
MSAIVETSSAVEQNSRDTNLSHSLTIAVAGNPNAGKTSLFNSLYLRTPMIHWQNIAVALILVSPASTSAGGFGGGFSLWFAPTRRTSRAEAEVAPVVARPQR